MFLKVTASVMILVMGVTTVAPAQIFTSNRRSYPRTLTTIPSTAPADSTAGLPALPPRGLDEPIDPDTYVIGPGDQFVVFLRPMATEFPLTVLPEGAALVPNAGLVPAAGLTITEFRARLQSALNSFYRGSEVFCQLTMPRTFVVYVLGEVKNPGAIEVTAPFRVDTVVQAAGGVLDRGSRREIEIREDGAAVAKVDLVRLERLGDRTSNVMLHEGQTVFVPARGPVCQVAGEVWRSGSYELVPGETAADIVAIAGGFTSNAAVDDMVLERLSEDGEISIDPLREADLATTLLRDRDVIVVSDKRSFPGIDFIRVQGGGGRDGRIYLAEGETLDSFRPRFIRLRNDYDLSNSKIERKQSDGSIEFIPVDLSQLVRGDTSLDVALQPGDVINIPRLEDVVFVSGEVVVPGQVDFQRGLPAGRYIAMVGGPTDVGSVDKLEIYDDRGNRRDGDRDSVVYRGETILVKRRTAVVLGNVFIGFVSLTSLFLSAYAVINSNNN
ncbi:MAG TPA: SLBB domain-containing protein [Candidatus Krumholzibacteria bacterium]|nr:SLBB domain-containing protein [Candidatus Krumholzibacteria bacterium]